MAGSDEGGAAEDVERALGGRMEHEVLAAVERAVLALAPEAAFTFGEAARKKKWYRAGIALFQRAGNGLDDPSLSASAAAECYAGLRDWAAALREVDRALALGSINRRLFRLKARCLAKLGRRDEALLVLQGYSRLAPGWVEPWAEMARIHASASEHAATLTAVTEAVVRGGETQELLGYKVDALVALGREREAEVHFGSIARSDPALVARWIRMYVRMCEPVAAAHAWLGLAGARGHSSEVVALENWLLSELATNLTLPRPAAEAALTVLDLGAERPSRPSSPATHPG